MAVSKFVELFEEKLKKNNMGETFSFNDYLNELNTLTPTKDISKLGLAYDLTDEEIFDYSKECILRNLINNTDFKKESKFSLEIIFKVYEFMKKTTYSPDLLAESFILLHSSKCNGKWHNFKAFFEHFDCHIVKREDFEYYDELKSLFESILKIDYFKSTVIDSVKNLYAKADFNFSHLELVMLNCGLESLLGFAGKNKIYVNVQQFLHIKKNRRFKWFLDEEKNIVFNLEFIRLIFHETVHVVLRSNTKDLNSSSPFLDKKKPQQPIISEKDLLELGLKTEIKVFHGLLNLLDSFETGELNVPLCAQFVEDFLANKQVDFNLEKSQCKTFRELDFLKMALDYRPRESKRFF
ncbi:unnamed protein product [Brachionus calyciflorus]|uniref:Uncharacterized protein n=1 Tax=Brachionus calyciflorus TaxID=104777 RepID=A0A814NUV0_9BILA|nr:unnamed protein product [Brachionus calyciflorus]